MKEGKTRYVILGLLAEGPMSGYTIKKLVEARFRFFWSESYGQLYPELKALVAEGMIEALPKTGETEADRAVAAASGRGRARGRDRTVHALLPAGREALREWLARPPEREPARFEILLKMYFSGQGDRAWMDPHLRAFEAHYAGELAVLRRFEAELRRIGDPDGSHADILRVIDFGQRTYEAYLAWCRTALAEREGRTSR
jgi:PadR family transcriptional regulator, regulatory protein AphA